MNLERIELMLQSAESDQRGFIITGEESYFDHHRKTVLRINGQLAEFLLLKRTWPYEPSKFATLKAQVEHKLKELSMTMDIRRKEGFTKAQSLFSKDLDQDTMDLIHASISDIRANEMRSMAEREEAAAMTSFGR